VIGNFLPTYLDLLVPHTLFLILRNECLSWRIVPQAVPTVIAMKDGKVVDKFVGLIDEDKLGAFMDKLKAS
jgi:hypothetical protein